ncbi:MAG: methyltransferase domain-containing protein [Gammaproteobacteria bacterium]
MSIPSFDKVQGSEDPDALIRYLAEVSERPEIRAHAQRRAKRAGIGPGDAILDIGCGIGSNTKLLAGMVGHGGHVTGIDIDAGMIAAARGRTTAKSVSFESADAQELPFDDGAFDAVWVERTLVHIPDPGLALHECRRVLRAGGTAVIAELDYAGVLIDDPEDPGFTSMILHETVSAAAHPGMGRELVRRVRSADLSVAEVLDELHRNTDFSDLAMLLGLERGCRRAITQGAANEQTCRQWWERLAALSEQGLFTGLLPSITVIARA